MSRSSDVCKLPSVSHIQVNGSHPQIKVVFKNGSWGDKNPYTFLLNSWTVFNNQKLLAIHLGAGCTLSTKFPLGMGNEERKPHTWNPSISLSDSNTSQHTIRGCPHSDRYTGVIWIDQVVQAYKNSETHGICDSCGCVLM